MANAYILHGRGADPTEAWIPWLKRELILDGHTVYDPKMPNANFPKQQEWEATLDSIVGNSFDNIFIGHSLASQTILRYIASKNTPARGIFLVAPFQDIDYDQVYHRTIAEIPKLVPAKSLIGLYSVLNAHKWCDPGLPWDKLSEIQDKMHLFFSTDDYYVKESQQSEFRSRLPRAKITIIENGGHLGEYAKLKQFPLLLETIRKNIYESQ